MENHRSSINAVRKLKRNGDYRLWAAQIRAYLTTMGGHRWLTEEPEEDDPDAVGADGRVRNLMLLCVEDRGLVRIIDRAATTLAAWEAVRTEYEAQLELRQPLLVSELNDVRQGASESYTAYAERVFELLEKLEDTDFEAADQLAANALVRGLKKSQEQGSLILTLTSHVSAGFHRVMSELKSAVRLIEGSQQNDRGADGKVLTAHARWKPKPSPEKRACYNCGKVGHLKKDCRLPKKQAEGPAAAMMAWAECMQAAEAHVAQTGAVLYDSGSSHHIVHDMSVVKDLRPSDTKRVVLGGGEHHDVLGEGEVWLRGGPRGPVILRSALLVPSMSVNLVSGFLATEAGHDCRQSGSTCTIRDPKGRVILTGSKQKRLYRLDCEMMAADAAVDAAAHAITSTITWHRRLCHPGLEGLQKVAAEAGLQGISADDHALTCGVCLKAKQTREPFQRSVSQATEVLELLHTDLMGPFQVPSWGGAVYAVTLLDDHSRMAEVSCITQKSDVFGWIRDTIHRWERQTGKKVKAVRSDNGTEYKGRLEEFFRIQGIVHQTSADYTPEQNGRAERLNRTLMEKVRAMLQEFDLAPEFWAAALDTACHVRNCMPTAGETQSPHMLFYGTAPDVERLRVFGCTAYVHVPSAKRKKLDARAEAGIFAGYERDSKAWRVYVWRRGKFICVKSRNVRFDETCTVTMPRARGLRRSDEDLTFLQRDGISVGDPALEQEPEAFADMPPLVPASDDEDSDDEDGVGAAGVPAGDDDGEGGSDEDSADGDDGAAMPGRDAGEPRRSQRDRRAPDFFQPHAYAYAADGLTDEPKTTKEALARPDAPLWQQSMDAEWTSIQEKGVLEPVGEVPRGKRVLPMKAVFKIKRDAQGAVDKYKTRLVVLGCLQRKGADFEEVFAPTAQQATFRVMLAHAAEHGLELHQFDVATAFLNGELDPDDEVYVRMPDAFGGQVYRLRKALYGLKQAARAWHAKLLSELTRLGFAASDADPCMFYRGADVERVYLLIYVDDGIIIGRQKEVQAALADIAGAFDIKDVGEVSYFLGLQLRRNRAQGQIWLGQPKYARDMLQRFGMSDCKPVVTPLEANTHLGCSDGEPVESDIPYAELVGSLLYLTVNTRPDLAFSAGVLSRFVAAPSDVHWKAAKRVLRYIAGTLDRGIQYQKGQVEVEAFTDADYAGEQDSRKSTSGAVVLMRGAPVVWKSKLQTVVAASTCEAEYIAAAAAAKEALWVRKLIGEMSGQVQRIPLYGDNQSALVLMKQHTSGASGRTKHIDVPFHFVRHRVMQGDLEAVYVPTDEMKADILTKALPGPKHEAGACALGLKVFE